MQDPKAYMAVAQTLAAKGIGYDTSDAPRRIDKAVVIGAGTMGTGITMVLAAAGVTVTLVDKAQSGLDRARISAANIWTRSVDRGQIDTAEVDRRLARISFATDMADTLADADLVIEAVWEQMALKKEIFARIDALAKPGALLGTNTSTLDIDEIAAVTTRPQDVIGLHFFSPAHVMKLVEVVRGKRSSAASVRDALSLAIRLGKTPVVVGVCFGFVGNRIFGARENEARSLLLEGAMPQQVDRVLVEFGFPMGSFLLQDMSGGIELLWRMNQSKGIRDELIDRLAELGRFGQKSGRGFYAYGGDGRTPLPDPEVEAIILQVSKDAGITRRTISDTEICERLIYPMINEGAKIVEEGVADRPSDIDVIWSLGYGWPKDKAGPMYFADVIGLPVVRDTLVRLQAAHGDRFAPAPLLEHLARAGGKFTEEGKLAGV
ncbi:3-hydroxyacyl-CoA dehydrogenase [Sphingobium sp. MK2]|uniref:3-hydroxyacyl-CoA dehydrogenase n=1 Tax=Sphingobium sp. MK2 TaxID=3116540 RepID=UPI0032E35E3A